MYLVNQIRDAITVNFLKSHQSTGGNDPIYPEIVAAVGLRFLGPGDSIAVLADLYGMSISSCKRCINMFLNAIDYNTDCVEMRVELPDPSDHSALRNLAQAWSSVSTAFDLFNYNLGCLDGWLPFTEAPDVPNAADYFSGHYQSYGLNVQALCDPDLLFLFVAVAAPGKVNDWRAVNRCTGLLQWLDSLPLKYYSIADNAYSLSRRILVPFECPELVATGNLREFYRTYNYYLSQLRIRIEMAFGLLTTKWRIFQRRLIYKNNKNSKIIRVATKLHNFCIRMKQREGGGRIGTIRDHVNIRFSQYGIDTLKSEDSDGVGRVFNDTQPSDDPSEPIPLEDYATLMPDGQRRHAILQKITERGLRRPDHNIERSGDA